MMIPVLRTGQTNAPTDAFKQSPTYCYAIFILMRPPSAKMQHFTLLALKSLIEIKIGP
jgi:hypothetical protein